MSKSRALKTSRDSITRPLLKWAGGKSQLLGEILPKMPQKYGRFIEPFFGGGALFFAVHPVGGIIADSNPELVNLYRSVADDVEGVIRVDIDAQKMERANQIHWKLIDSKSAFLDARQLEPLANEHIDLFAADDGDIILYEMKSVDSESGNLLAQVRKAVAQLYEYRYIYEEPKARLCIVTNYEITKKDDWLIDYLSKDRLIAYEWTKVFKTLNAVSAQEKSLAALFLKYL
ncbi:MAG: DNA adenine methylase [Gallionella sp.]|nr:DNA adenine methylase [Gallionella sp.]